MGVFRFVMASAFCLVPAVALVSAESVTLIADNSDQGSESTSKVVPLPEAGQQYSEPTPVDAIVVDKDGNMTETQYTYDPDQGGVVINNYNQVAGPDCSVFFPLFSVGFLWWNGYWVDHNGYYWNGYGYGYVNNHGWHNQWNHYWHGNWNNKWHNYRQQHPNSRHNGGHHGGNYNHHNGTNRSSHNSQRNRGGHGGAGSHGGGHRGGGHGGGRGGGGGHGGGRGGGGHGR